MRTAVHLAILAALLAWLALGGPPVPTRMWRAAFDAGHVPLFGVIALLLEDLVRRSAPHWSPRQVASAALAATTLIGLAAEGLQTLVPNRDASLVDAARNAAGGAAFLLTAACWRARSAWPTSRRRLALVMAGVFLACALAELARAAAVQVAMGHAMPVLVRFDGSWWEPDVLDLGENDLIPSRGTALARLRLRPGTYSGVRVAEAHPDWTGYAAVTFDIDCPAGPDVHVSIRINDWNHDNDYADRFNRQVTLVAGLNSIRIPLAEVQRAPAHRDMDLSRIRTVILFVHQLDHPLELGVSPIRLEPAPD